MFGLDSKLFANHGFGSSTERNGLV